MWILLCICALALTVVSAGHPHPLASIQLDALEVVLDTDVTISTNVSTVSHHGWVEVTWTLPDPSVHDWIGVYSPSDVAVPTHVPVKYVIANMSPQHMTGTGNWAFRMVSNAGTSV